MKAIEINGPEHCQQDISNSIEDLNEISSQFCANDLDHKQILKAYRTSLEHINETLSETEFTGVWDLIRIFIEGVEALVDSGRELSNDECRFLLKFPNMLVEYFSLPLSKLPGKLLVRFFKNPDWVRPISDSEENKIFDLICQQTEKVETKHNLDHGFIYEDQDVEFENEEETDFSDALEKQKAEPEIIENSDAIDEDVNENADIENVDLQAAVDVVDFNELDGDEQAEEISLNLFAEPNLADETADTGSGDIIDLGQFQNDLTEEIPQSEPEVVALDSLNEDLTEEVIGDDLTDISEETDNIQEASEIDLNALIDLPNEEEASKLSTELENIEPVSITDFISEQEEVSLGDILNDQSIESDNTETEESVEKDQVSITDFITEEADQALPETIAEEVSESSDVDSTVACNIDENQQLLIDLVRAELAEVLDDRDADLQTLKDENDTDHKKHLLTNYAEQAENISHAVELIGLDGLSKCSEFISNNITHLSTMAEGLNEDQYQLLYEWPVKLFAYLQNINDEVASQQLVEFLSWQHWPISLSADEINSIHDLLVHPVLEEEEKVQRQTVASEADMTLELPEDVNQELLEGLLHDLPDQTEEFTGAIESLKQSGTKADIETAQRIAHTLKGAANVVGVKGMASLTHHLEDILEYLSNKDKQPTKALLEVLIAASDCLEGMTESLLGIDEAPDNAVSVLQSVLDWANILDNDGLPEEGDEVSVDSAVTVELADKVDNKVEPAHVPLKANNQNTKDDSQETKDAAVTPVSSENVLRIPVSLADELLRIAGESLISNTQIEDRINNSLTRQETLSQHSSTLQQISFDLEQLIDIQGLTTNFTTVQDEDDFDALEMDKFHELHSVSRRLVEITSDSMQLSQTLKSELGELKNLVIDQDKLQKNNQELVLRTRMVPVKSIIPRLKRGVRQVCRLTGKSVDLNIFDNDTYMDSEVLNEMIEPLMHILRNAVDHGIESTEVREHKQKPVNGTINVHCNRKGDQIIIDIKDDGKGLDQEFIYNKAKNKGIVSATQDLSEDAVYRLILEPGFTTRDEVTQTSGRGIGLDVVNNKLRSLKGSINIENNTDVGTTFQIVLPISSFSTHSLMVRVRQYIYAISNRGVEEVLYPGSGELREVGGQLFFHIEGEAYEAKVIDELLNLPADRRNIDRGSRPIVIVRDDAGERHAILVQAVLDSRDVVVKSMGQYMPKIRGTVGATVLGDGSIAPVVDLPELLRDSHGQLQTIASANDQVAPATKRIPYVLVVDDSLSARRSLAQFTEDLGMNTRTARDGMEAASIIEARKPDLVLVDMEMPRMNGLELTAHIRANEKTRDVPVIMITSRSSDKHKETAMNKGVNYFIVKPFDEDKLAANINEALELNS